jgi:hypothetical protein
VRSRGRQPFHLLRRRQVEDIVIFSETRLVVGIGDRAISRNISPTPRYHSSATISDAHEGLKAAVAKLLNATWQRCRVHFARNALAYAGKNGRRVVAAVPPAVGETPG